MRITAIVLVAVVVAAGAVWLAVRHETAATGHQEKSVLSDHGGRFKDDGDSFVGYGWSVNPDVATAVRQALAKAEGPSPRETDITFVFYTSHHDPDAMVAAVESVKGRGAAVCGWSSDYGVVSPDGYHCSTRGAVGVLSLKLSGLDAGVGWAELDEVPSPAECARLALRRAIKHAGREAADQSPSMLIMSATYDGQEETYVEALTEETGGLVPVLGGTAGGSPRHGPGDCSVLAGGKVFRKGLVVAVFYSSRPFGWSFRGGYDRTGSSGVITESLGRTVLKIDGRPALEVLDEWSGGRIAQAMAEGEDMNTFTGLYPLCRTFKSDEVTHNLFVHAWPPEDGASAGCLVTSANLWTGDVVYFAEGSWNILLNRIGNLVQLAKAKQPETPVAAGLLICCEAVLKNIPPDQRGQISWLINRSMGDAPWIGMFTWGEQGNFADVGNYHGNLLTSFTLFPQNSPGDK